MTYVVFVAVLGVFLGAFVPAAGAAPRQRETAKPLPAFTASIKSVSGTQVVTLWHPGCPVAPKELRELSMRYVDFNGKPHVGTMIVNAAVTTGVISVFRQLYNDRFPIERMVPESAYGGSDPIAMASNDTSAFNCRYAVATGPKHWSVHAYGEAIDVNPVQNPYIEGGAIQPTSGRTFLNRKDVRPGMAELGGTLVRAFASIGWQWGGRWASSPDYQHFSLTGG